MENQQNLNQLILSYNGYNSFIKSLRSQLQFKGYLSPRQLECAQSFFKGSNSPVAALSIQTHGLGKSASVTDLNQPSPKAFSMAKGDKIMIRKWFANNKAKELGLKVFFRGLIIEEVVAETPRAMLVKVTFNSKLSTYCHCCGLNLDTEISKATGIGPVCAKKYLGFKRVSMADAPAILAKVEEECKIAGVIGPIWIPKKQMVSKAEQILFDKE